MMAPVPDFNLFAFPVLYFGLLYEKLSKFLGSKKRADILLGITLAPMIFLIGYLTYQEIMKNPRVFLFSVLFTLFMMSLVLSMVLIEYTYKIKRQENFESWLKKRKKIENKKKQLKEIRDRRMEME